MEFTISKQKFVQLIQPLTSICDRKLTMPILGNVLISVENAKLSLIASDLEIEMAVNCPLEGDFKNGEITAPGRKLFDICSRLQENADVTFKLDEERLIITSARSRFILGTLPAADFPIIQSISPKIETILPQATLRYLIESVQFAMANQDVRYYLNGLLFEADSSSLRVIATDGHRLAVSSVDESPLKESEKLHLIIPRKAVNERVRLLSDKPGETIRFQMAENHIRLETDQFVFITKLIEGRFPDYKRVLPQGGDKVISIDRDSLKQGLTRVAILSSEKHRGIRMQLAPGSLRIFANNPEQEHAEEEIVLPYEGDSFEIGFNASYLLDVLNTVPSGEVKLIMQDATCSTLIQSDSKPERFETLYVVMPLRL
jgi:DNA polymerase-3 subunit beta